MLRVGDPRAAEKQAELLSRQSAQSDLLTGKGELATTVQKRVFEEVAEMLKQAQNLRYSKSPEAPADLRKIFDTLTNALSKTEAPARIIDGEEVRRGPTEFENVQQFLQKQLGTKSEQAALATAIGRASDLLIGKGPSSPTKSSSRSL